MLHLPLADPDYGKPQGIDVLLGAEIYGQILVDGLRRNPEGTLTAQNTLFGWILSGRVLDSPDNCFNNIISMHIQDDSINTLLRRFWELETEVPKELMSKEDEMCEAYYSSRTTRDGSGRYCVKLPFREADPKSQYGEFKSIAERRLKSLEKKFEKNHFLKEEYTKAMNDYINSNHMERITEEAEIEKPNCVYLPHHAVIRNDKTTSKVRIVFDAACKGIHGKSLNDDLLVGPRLQPDLRHLIMRWRTHVICFTADVIKMYRQILVDKADTDYQRLLWREKPDSDIGIYRMLRVTFGVASAPYLAVKTLQQIAKDEGHAFPLAAEIVAKDFYMDDCLSGCKNDEEALEIYHQMVGLLRKGGFELQKWMSNSSKLMELIHSNAKITKSFNTNDEVVKILGLSWNATKDIFQYTVNLPKQPKSVTKRVILSDISRLYDPLGWIAPVVIQAKIYMQKLWLKGLSWDEEVPRSLLDEWIKYRTSLPLLNSFEISRWIGVCDSASVELHGFCDASNSAYAAVTYLRVVDEAGVHDVQLVAARTKVAPVKQVSTPRLELSGAVLLAKLLSEVSTVLNIPQAKLFAWTDSTIVLAWLKGEPNRWKTFVANRVTEILNVLNNDQWSHVQSGDNPADMASRGLTPEELMSQQQFWMQGPQWLREDSIPVSSNVTTDTHLEEKQVKSHMVTADTVQPMAVWDKYSSLKKLIRVIAYCKRFISKLRNKNTQFSTHLTARELDEATTMCIKQCQASAFQEEITQLLKDKSVKRSSNTFSLCPLLDKDGVMRVRGRIQQSREDYDTKHPIILPYGHHISKLIVANAHEETLHGGPQLTLNYIRSKFWIINAKGLVRQHIKKCLRCTRYSSSHQHPFMGELPSSRVLPSRPFSKSGVDYAGPVNIRMSKGRGCKSYKGYICLFICMSTKAIHLEAVTDLTSEGFLAAFRRFVARRGNCQEVWSDNGTNFVKAAKELRKLFQAEDSTVMSEVAASLANNGTEWHFIPPRAPNFGGLWEGGVRSTKYHLKRVLDGSTLTFEELSTVLAQIEACLNSRPMYRLPSNQADSSPLTPGHFLIGEPLLTVPDHKYENCKVSNLRRWQMTQKMVQQFWRKWSQEYLSTLHNRYKWTKIIPEPNVGDIVLVKEDDLPPSKWLLGRIESKHPGPDQITRVVTLKCKGSKFKRPVSKLCVLPVTD
ncbi:uncharacterized protein [Maniola hyperantus]|uniref:uncharacterized protein n=1 Tax=Aphantopus hyperantus TaxID=2795564 RepID=UPI00374796EF